MQKLVECVSEPSSDLKIPFHVSCKFVFLCLVKVSCNQTEKNVAFVFWAGLAPQGGENAQTKRRRQKEQKRSRKEAFVKKKWVDLKQNFVKQLCERVRHSDVFTSKTSKIEISTCYISACFALLAGSSAVAFFALCRVPFVHTRWRKTLWISAPLHYAFFCARPNLQQKNLKLSDSLSSLFFLFLCVCCGSSGGRLPRKTLPNRGTLQQSHLVESNQVSIHDAIFKMDFAKDLEFWDMPHRKCSETINLSAKTSMITYHQDWSTKPP